MKKPHWTCLVGLLFLAACTAGDRQRRLAQLQMLEQRNIDDSLMTDDSLAEQLADYFDRHGTPNEQLRAHYILGRTYADLGEAPAALNAYQDAADCADTTAQDCDWAKLCRVYGQMSIIYHQQNLPHDEIKSIQKMIDYSKEAGDTVNHLFLQENLVKPYYLLGEKDSILSLVYHINAQLVNAGHQQLPALGLGAAAYICVERGDIEQAGQLLQLYEQRTGVVGADGFVQRGWENYYWIKGFYELGINQIDSAEIYFRKAIIHSTIFADESNGYKGLLAVYQRRQNIDSIIKYSHLNEAALDSLHNQMQTDATKNISALYNYTRSQKEAENEARKRKIAWNWFEMLLIVFAVLSLLSYLYYRKKQKEKLDRIIALHDALFKAKDEKSLLMEELKQLQSQNYEVLIAEKEKRVQELTLRITQMENERGDYEACQLSNNMDAFKNSLIVKVFNKKKYFKSGDSVPNKSEWNALISQFRKDMPVTYQTFKKDKKLSPQELYTCILLLLGYDESVITGLLQTSSQSISVTKSRANKKLFNEKSAVSLKYNLERLVDGF